MQSMMDNAEKYINEKGTDLEKEALVLIKDFFKENNRESVKEFNNRVKKLQDDLLNLKK